MSIIHKAYEFDYKEFHLEFEDILFMSLNTQDIDALVKFVNSNIQFCKYPWESEKLTDNWQEELEIGDVHEVGDYGLTKFYDPNNDYGLGYYYSELSEKYPKLEEFVLGIPFGPTDNYFDPGKMGSYFLIPEKIGNIVTPLRKIMDKAILDYAEFLYSCEERGKGVYITF